MKDMENTKIIPLSKGYSCIIDAEDYEKITSICKSWHAGIKNGLVYAESKVWRGERQVAVSIHRVVMDAPSGVLVDHINHDTLDNRKSNLRLVTRQQNQCNVKPRSGNWSRFKGVCFNKRVNRWVAYINSFGRREYLGYYDDELDAARAYDAASLRLHGEYGYLNLGSHS